MECAPKHLELSLPGLREPRQKVGVEGDRGCGGAMGWGVAGLWLSLVGMECTPPTGKKGHIVPIPGREATGRERGSGREERPGMCLTSYVATDHLSLNPLFWNSWAWSINRIVLEQLLGMFVHWLCNPSGSQRSLCSHLKCFPFTWAMPLNGVVPYRITALSNTALLRDSWFTLV